MTEIIGVTFKDGGKVYYFAPGKGEYPKGSGVVVETARGVEYATVTIPRSEVEDEKLVTPLKPVLRAATERDIETHRKNTEKKPDAMKLVREKIAAAGLDMKLIDCEFAFDGNKAVFYYTAPKRVDFRELVKELSSAFCMRIELRQVGLRDGIQMLGGLAPCGRECCCATCMPDIKKVSIKMAKNQGLSLNPSKISGLCGRLMCCLSYENDYYAEACKSMPKLGSEIATPDGTGTVVNLNMLKMQIRVRIDDKTKDIVTYKDFTVDEIEAFRSGAKVGVKESEKSEETENGGADGEKAARDERRGGEKRRKDRPHGGNGQKGDRPERADKSPQKRENASGAPQGGNAQAERPQGEKPQGESGGNRSGKNRYRHKKKPPQTT